MTDLNLDQPATLRWLDVAAEDMAEAPGWHGEERAFETAREAIRFCIEDLSLRLRNFARIAAEDGTFIEHADVERLYREFAE